ncbi:MAG: threonine synthase [Syntrophales bacterium]|nr:threonine synthase [Syntrophales bacterium]
MPAILYYSTNARLSPDSGITPFRDCVSFREALLMGQAPDEGLFMPCHIPPLTLSEVERLKGKPYQDAAFLIASAFLKEDLSEDLIRQVVDDSYNYPVPIERVTDKIYLLRLDQGPTASFKDFAARMMARLMSILRPAGKRLHVLVATSGDTGSAVGEAFRGVDGIDVTILYPRNEVSPRQKRQLDTIGENVQAISIDGKFDDCQNLVKEAFADPELKDLNLTSANSINFGRILPQIIYYVWSYAQVAEPGQEIVFSVPSGNFGNALGCEYARRMGLPVRRLVMPTNENDEFPRFLATGEYRKVSPSRACLSSAMNVGHPSNLARFFELYGGTVDRTGIVHKYPDLEEMRKHIFSVSISDKETKDTIVRVFKDYNVLLEPHGAVGWRGLEIFLSQNTIDDPCIILETAHPAKFPDEIGDLLGIEPEVPPSLKEIENRSGRPIEMPASYESLKRYLREKGVREA